jgi:aspartyl-tRNA(Asn)/glutamyl-tRNA(Gln) amidotransferase subunit B
MTSKDVKGQYKATIGIECHVQLKTKTKLFSAVDNDAREAAPNTLISHIDLGMPGALPVLNERAVELAMMAAFALGTEPQKYSKFDRKHYFYPDLPMGYQITQFYDPIIKNGEVTINVGDKEKKIGIHEAHLEADAGKSIHPVGKDYSLVDLNRAGTPLLEIVSEPDMHSAEEAKIYAKELWIRMRYAGISDANLYYGNMRFDVNVSVSKNDELGTRTETKNLNSFRSVEKAIEFEIDRQIERLETGEKIVQETRGWDEAKQKTFSQRSKEEAHDYRYMPDPDIPPIVLTSEQIEKLRSKMPSLPSEYRIKLRDTGIDASTIEDIIAEPEMAKTILRILESTSTEHARRVAFWLLQEQPNEESLEAGWTHTVEDEQLIKLSQLVQDGKLSSSAAKQVLAILQKDGGDALEISQTQNLIQESDESAVAEIVAKVLAENPKAAQDVKNGEMKAIGFLVGQIMKESRGKANPTMAQQLIKKQLGV